jgi:hypothetical protein
MFVLPRGRRNDHERSAPILGLNATAAVYGRDAVTSRFTTVLRTGLRCRLAHVPRGGQTGPDRAELAALRVLLWEPGYVMPETAQIEVDGVRWQPVAGTFGALKGPIGAVTYRQADVRRQAA